MPVRPQRKRTRMPGYDYAWENRYFITLCTDKMQCFFGDGSRLSPLGELAAQELARMGERTPGVTAEVFAIMPNHIHAIITIERMESDVDSACESVGNGFIRSAQNTAPPTGKRAERLPTLSDVVGRYKAGVTRQAHRMGMKGTLWQSSFYDRIIRNDAEYQVVWRYIVSNPRVWREGR